MGAAKSPEPARTGPERREQAMPEAALSLHDGSIAEPCRPDGVVGSGGLVTEYRARMGMGVKDQGGDRVCLRDLGRGRGVSPLRCQACDPAGTLPDGDGTAEREGLLSDDEFPQPVRGLLSPRAYPHPVARIEVVETHISWVLLTGTYAYKVKKPVDLGFVNFTTLERRRHACRDELRLNRRLAASLYLDVVPVTGTPANPRVGEPGVPGFEYAVKMRQFEPAARLDRQLVRGLVSAEDMDAIASRLAAFHATLVPAAPDCPYGEPDQVQAAVRDNFAAVHPAALDGGDGERLESLRSWSEHPFAGLRDELRARKRNGFVRECHGDLHLGNLARVEGRILPFDCIEFSAALRWIDVLSEAAFLWMDLLARRRSDLAFRFLNAYLAGTGDYAGLILLAYYGAYRAMVRVKVAAIRLSQPDLLLADADEARRDLTAHLALARALTVRRQGAVLITRGLSGSGKSYLARALAERLPAVHVRSDVERKRLYGLDPLARSGSGLDAGIYSPAASRRTYARLRDIARAVVRAGLVAVVDAAFLDPAQRTAMRRLAKERDVPLVILECRARPEVLRRRVGERAAARADASEADSRVLDRQLACYAPLSAGEEQLAIAVQTDEDLELDVLVERLRDRLGVNGEGRSCG